MPDRAVLTHALEKIAHASHVSTPLAIVCQTGNVLIVDVARRRARLCAGIGTHFATTLFNTRLRRLDPTRSRTLASALSAHRSNEPLHPFRVGERHAATAKDRDGLEFLGAHHRTEPTVATG